jgi:hypothetical protein
MLEEKTKSEIKIDKKFEIKNCPFAKSKGKTLAQDIIGKKMCNFNLLNYVIKIVTKFENIHICDDIPKDRICQSFELIVKHRGKDSLDEICNRIKKDIAHAERYNQEGINEKIAESCCAINYTISVLDKCLTFEETQNIQNKFDIAVEDYWKRFDEYKKNNEIIYEEYFEEMIGNCPDYQESINFLKHIKSGEDVTDISISEDSVILKMTSNELVKNTFLLLEQQANFHEVKNNYVKVCLHILENINKRFNKFNDPEIFRLYVNQSISDFFSNNYKKLLDGIIEKKYEKYVNSVLTICQLAINEAIHKIFNETKIEIQFSEKYAIQSHMNNLYVEAKESLEKNKMIIEKIAEEKLKNIRDVCEKEVPTVLQFEDSKKLDYEEDDFL